MNFSAISEIFAAASVINVGSICLSIPLTNGHIIGAYVVIIAAMPMPTPTTPTFLTNDGNSEDCFFCFSSSFNFFCGRKTDFLISNADCFFTLSLSLLTYCFLSLS